MSEKRCYTVQELQEILGVSRPTIYNLLKKKEFAAAVSGWIMSGKSCIHGFKKTEEIKKRSKVF